MRSRKEIEANIENPSIGDFNFLLILEVVLDIRDLLMKGGNKKKK